MKSEHIVESSDLEGYSAQTCYKFQVKFILLYLILCRQNIKTLKNPKKRTNLTIETDIKGKHT